MPDPLVAALASATADTVVRLEIWVNGMSNPPPPMEYLRPASTIHADPTVDIPIPPRERAIMWTPAGSTVNIRNDANISAAKFAVAPAKTAITFFIDTAKSQGGYSWIQVLEPVAWVGKWVARDVLTATDPN